MTQPLTMALLEKAIVMTNRAARELDLGSGDNSTLRASIFKQILNDLVYGPPEPGDDDADLPS